MLVVHQCVPESPVERAEGLAVHLQPRGQGGQGVSEPLASQILGLQLPSFILTTWFCILDGKGERQNEAAQTPAGGG